MVFCWVFFFSQPIPFNLDTTAKSPQLKPSLQGSEQTCIAVTTYSQLQNIEWNLKAGKSTDYLKKKEKSRNLDETSGFSGNTVEFVDKVKEEKKKITSTRIHRSNIYRTSLAASSQSRMDVLEPKPLRPHSPLPAVYRGHSPQARPGSTSATSTEENRLTALLSRMGFPQIRCVVADS